MKLSTGDLLITRDTSEHQGYTLSTTPNPPQIRYRSYDQALAAAKAWTAQHGVAIWLTEDGTSFKPIVTRGGATASPSRTPAKDSSSTTVRGL